MSPWFTDVAVAGDTFELRGPIGGYFVWDVSSDGPVMLVGGGSGVVPLMAMARHRQRKGLRIPMQLLYSARFEADLLYRAELDQLTAANDGFRVAHTLTREAPSGWSGLRGRVDAQMLADVNSGGASATGAYVCGPTPFVESVAKNLLLLGLTPGQVKTERFGPTGGNP